jgi:phosphoribosylformylglycinamidine cyclo-ligase
VVERSRAIDGSTVADGDVVLGLPASGLHANGYSLVRSLVAEWDLSLAEPYQTRLRRTLGDAVTEGLLVDAPHEAMATLGEVLLTPTRIYARGVLAVRDAGVAIHGLAHVTGGGLPGNVPRALPPGLGARLDPTRWAMPSVMRLFGALGGLDDAELRATFNGGIGMVVVLPPADVPTAIGVLAAHGIGAGIVGEIVPEAALGGARYAEGPLEMVLSVEAGA